MKGLTSQQLVDLDCHVILGNTYHLENRPGSDIVAQMAGLHGFIGWPRGMLTDSGGFQVLNPDISHSVVQSMPWSAILDEMSRHSGKIGGKTLGQLHASVRPLLAMRKPSYPQPTIEAPVYGLQMVSLLHLANITEEGVQFASPVDGSMMMLTPEHSMAIQNKLGAPALQHCSVELPLLLGPKSEASLQGTFSR